MVTVLWIFNKDIVTHFTTNAEIQELAINGTYVLLLAVFPVSIVYS